MIEATSEEKAARKTARVLQECAQTLSYAAEHCEDDPPLKQTYIEVAADARAEADQMNDIANAHAAEQIKRLEAEAQAGGDVLGRNRRAIEKIWDSGRLRP